MKPPRREVWRIAFSNVTSYIILARDVDDALRRARRLFKINHTRQKPITSIQLLGTMEGASD
jgi:hypothetical protein